MSEANETTRPAAGRGGLRRLYGALWHHAEGRRRLVAAFLVLLFLAQAARLAMPYFFGESVNALQNSGAQDVAAAGWNTLLMLGAAVLGWALHGPGRVIERFVAVHIRERLADRLYAKAVGLPMRWHESHHSGESIQRMNKATAALFGFSQHQFVYLQNAVSLIGPIAALCIISAATGAAAVAGYVVIAVILVRFDAAMLRVIHKENQAERRYNAELVDCLGNISTVLTLRLQDATRRSVAERMRAVSEPLRRNIVVNEAKWCVIDLLNNVIRTGLVALYAWLSWREGGLIAIGTAVMVHQYAQQIGTVVGSMAGHWQDLMRYQADIGSADEILDAQGRNAAIAAAIPPDWRAIGIGGLSFTHAAKRSPGPTLDDVTLALKRGGRIALIGESGSGKSSLLRVLSGLYEADRVTLSADGVACAGLKDLGAIATLVPQDPEIFESSIGQNITMGIGYDPAQVARACELACLGPVLDRLPAGLDTAVSERGVNLSGGQKQRLALARGILASQDCSLIMLDEPTSSMDPMTEARIYDNLLAEFPQACIVSSIHRLHLLPRFDTVVLMADGRVVDIGSVEDLMRRQPRFQAMWRGYQDTGKADVALAG